MRDESGRDRLLILGGPTTLDREADAMEAVRTVLPALSALTRRVFFVPPTVERGHDNEYGAFLVVEPPPEDAEPPFRVASDRSAVVALLEDSLRLAEMIESTGLDWRPAAGDIFALASGVGVTRLRLGRPLPTGRSLDARSMIEEIGRALLAEASLTLPTPLWPTAVVNVVLPHRERARDKARSVAVVREDLEEAWAAETLGASDAHARPWGSIAAITDRGLHRERNEDAFVLKDLDDGWVVSVADGVSASHRADVAARIATATTCDRVHRLWSSPLRGSTSDLMRQAIAEAHEAICADHQRVGGDALGTTVVGAIVQQRRATIGWVGDSRAYWVDATLPGRSHLVTHDHSWLNEVVEARLMSIDDALRSPHAHALTRCLGPLEGGDPVNHATPDVLEFDAPGPGLLVICSDGLWNYVPTAEEIGDVLERTPEARDVVTIARVLANAALCRGGQDNVTVAVVRFD